MSLTELTLHAIGFLNQQLRIHPLITSCQIEEELEKIETARPEDIQTAIEGAFESFVLGLHREVSL